MSDLTWFDIVQLLKLCYQFGGKFSFTLLFHNRQFKASTTAVVFLILSYSELFCVDCYIFTFYLIFADVPVVLKCFI